LLLLFPEKLCFSGMLGRISLEFSGKGSGVCSGKALWELFGQGSAGVSGKGFVGIFRVKIGLLPAQYCRPEARLFLARTGGSTIVEDIVLAFCGKG
jgi:hypothetical protein